MVQKNEMALLNVKSQQFHVVTTSVFDPVAFTFDITRGWFSWADKRGNIHKSNEHHSWIIFSGQLNSLFTRPCLNISFDFTETVI